MSTECKEIPIQPFPDVIKVTLLENLYKHSLQKAFKEQRISIIKSQTIPAKSAVHWMDTYLKERTTSKPTMFEIEDFEQLNDVQNWYKMRNNKNNQYSEVTQQMTALSTGSHIFKVKNIATHRNVSNELFQTQFALMKNNSIENIASINERNCVNEIFESISSYYAKLLVGTVHKNKTQSVSLFTNISFYFLHALLRQRYMIISYIVSCGCCLS